MAGKEYKVICCDIDATLTWGINPVSEENARAIRDLMDKGILFGLGSGRAYTDLKTYPERWGMDRPFDFYVGLNGAALYDESTGINETFFEIEREYVKLIVEDIDQLGLVSHIYDNGITMFSKENDRVKELRKNKLRKFKVAEDLSEMYEHKTSKILINVPDEVMDEMKKHFEPVLHATNDTVQLARTSPGAMEFFPAQANKFYALKVYCDRHEIPMDQVIAVGDTTNDNEMIAGAGLGVCMLNGTDDTKALADVITEYPFDEDGFARFIYSQIL